jgi:hypothetical protein
LQFKKIRIKQMQLIVNDVIAGTMVFQLEATDDDAGWDGQVEFSSPLSQATPFVVLQTGHVILATPLDREATPTYDLPVTVSDRSLQSPVCSVIETIHVTVSDVNDVPPQCPLVPVSVLTYPWTGFTVTQVVCLPDADTVNGQMRYSLVAGNGDGVFMVGLCLS